MELSFQRNRNPSSPAARAGWLRWLAVGLVLAAATPLRAEIRAAAEYGRVPLMFHEAPALGGSARTFEARAPGLRVCASATGATLTLRSLNPSSPAFAERGSPAGLQFRFVGANPSAPATTEEPLVTRVNYLLGRDPAGWRAGVPTWAEVRFAGVYPGIDVVFYGNQGSLEYDFAVAPGVDPSTIRFQVEGADRVNISAEGDLVLRIGTAEVRQHRPVAYQIIDGQRRDIRAGYRMEGDTRPEVGFELGPYERDRPLVIDPVVVYASYLGGSLYDICRDIAVDADGNLYVVGETSSTNFPVSNALWSTNSGGAPPPGNPLGNEAFVLKLDPTGTNLLFATYLGGSQIDAALGITVDEERRIYVVGLTHSPDFPVTTDAWSTGIHGVPFPGTNGFYEFDAFVTELSADGGSVLYSTYLGGAGHDEAAKAALGPDGSLYVAGDTASSDFPVTNAPPRTITSPDIFVTRFAPGDHHLVYSTVFGGNKADLSLAIAVDAAGAAYVGGRTSSGDFAVTNAFQRNLNGDSSFDGVVTKVQPDGSGLAWSTYLGGSRDEAVQGLALDTNGFVYVTGYTTSANFPTNHALVSTNLGLRDIFLTKFDPTGTNLVYSTYLGGNLDDEAWDIQVDSAGAVYLAGATFSTHFPLASPLQSTNAGSRDAFVMKLDPSATRFLFSTFLGGTFSEEINALALGPDGSVYLAGTTPSTDFVANTGASGFQTVYGGGLAGDGLVTRIFLDDSRFRIAPAGADAVTILWPRALGGFDLESVASLPGSTNWITVPGPPETVDDEYSLTVRGLAQQQFFRLRRRD